MKRVLLLLLAGCGASYSNAATRVADRPRAEIHGTLATLAEIKDPRGATGTPSFSSPAVRLAKLSNGIRVGLIERHDLPIVSMTIDIVRSSKDNSAAMTVLLDRLIDGDLDKDPTNWGYLNWLGASIDRETYAEALAIQFKTLSSHTPSVVLTAGEILSRPDFSNKGVEDSKRDVANRAARLDAAPETAAHDAALSLLGLPTHANESAIARVSRDDLVRAYQQAVVPENIVIGVVGDFEAEGILHTLERAFGSLKGNAQAPASLATVSLTKQHSVLIDRPHSSQSAIEIVAPAPPLDDPSYPAFQLMCRSLGQKSERTRTAKGYTYGAQVRCSSTTHLALSMNVATMRTGEALRDLMAAIDALRTKPLTKEQLEDARQSLASRYTNTWGTNDDASEAIATQLERSQPMDMHASIFQRSAKVTPEDVLAIAQKILAEPRVAIVGDATRITGDVSGVLDTHASE